jgi:single-stranded DNA-binding protein
MLTATHKIEGQSLFVVAQCGDDLPTLCFGGKQKDTIVKWGKPGRMVAVAGALRTKITADGSKMTFVEVAYSRFLDKTEETTVKAETKAAAKAAPKAETKTKASAKAEEVVAATSPVDDEVPW